MARLEVDPIHLLGRLRHPDYIHMDWFSPEVLARDKALENIPRFGSIAEMTHRPTVAAHSMKVPFFSFYIGQALMEAGVELDQPKLVYMGQHHDDVEIVTGDIPSPKKRTANRTERRRMQKEEKEAIRQLEGTIPKPLWLGSVEGLMDEYRGQDTLESRIVNYFDKWDGLHEAVNEVVCGDNGEKFKEVIGDYKVEFDELNKNNRDWQQIATYIFGQSIFQFPNPDALQAKTLTDVDFSNAVTMAASLAKDNSFDYYWWLFMNTAIFKTWFFDYVLPGWKEDLPKEVKDDFELANTKMDVLLIRDLYGEFDPDFDLATFARTGLKVPKQHNYEIGTSIGDTLVIADQIIMTYLEKNGEKFREATGTRKAKGKYYRVDTD